jgi:hypothetical protein
MNPILNPIETIRFYWAAASGVVEQTEKQRKTAGFVVAAILLSAIIFISKQ